MRTKLRRMMWLWLCLGALVALSSFACRREQPAIQRTPHQVESELDALVVDDADLSKRAKAELTEEEIPAPPPPAPEPAPTPPRTRVMPKTETGVPATSAPVAQTEHVAEPPPSEEIPPPVPEPPPPPAPQPQAAARPQQPQQPWWPRPEEPRRKRDTAFDIAIAVGALGVGMGTAAASTSDGRAGETTFTVVSLGIGAAGFATALVLYATEPPPEKGVRVTVSPVGVNGRF